MRTGTAAARAKQQFAATRPGWYADRSAEPVTPAAVPQPGRVLHYHRDLGDQPHTLVGYVMDLGYDAGVVVTNDYYKVRVGGLSKNSFLLVRPGSLKDLIEPETGEDLAGEENAASGSADDLFDLLSRPRAQRPAASRTG